MSAATQSLTIRVPLAIRRRGGRKIVVAPSGTGGASSPIRVHVGLLPGQGGLDVRRITLQEITVVGCYCYTHVDFTETVAALAAGQLTWVEERPLADGVQAFRDLDAGTVSAAKIALRPSAGV